MSKEVLAPTPSPLLSSVSGSPTCPDLQADPARGRKCAAQTPTRVWFEEARVRIL